MKCAHSDITFCVGVSLHLNNFCGEKIAAATEQIMSDKVARALAITALVFMGIFVCSLTAALIDSALLWGGITYLALSSGLLGIGIFVVLKMTGHGFSITEMNNEMEAEKIRKENEELLAAAEENEHIAEPEAKPEQDGDEKSAEVEKKSETEE